VPTDVYPPGFATIVEVTGLTDGLCGAFRPGHFAGVATVVAKLLMQTAPDLAVFGEKDYQQLQVIRRLVRDLDMDVEIIGAPTVREPDGLAISSRNAYLSGAERDQAPALYRVLSQVADQVTSGSVVCDTACRAATDALLAAGFRAVDYVAVCDADTLQPLAAIDPASDRSARVLAAAWLGEARLIDNIAVPGSAT
jgi:pantoate--beta-alanine ligase